MLTNTKSNAIAAGFSNPRYIVAECLTVGMEFDAQYAGTACYN